MGRMKKRIKALTSLFVIAAYLLGIPYIASAAKVSLYGSEVILYDKPIAKGITYTEKQVFDNTNNRKNRVNIVTANLNDSDVSLIFSKAKDKERKVNVLTQQIQREIFKGNNVVAGVNADMFNMSTGFSSGPQIREGAIIAGHNSKSEEKKYPVLGIDKYNTAFIDYICLDAKLSANGNSTVIDNVNRESYKNSLILITDQLNDYKKVDFRNYASNGALTIVKGIKAPIQLGKEYEGTVETLGIGSKEVVVPEDSIVLASNGPKMDWVKSNLKSGDKVKIKVNYSRSAIQEVVGAYTYIVQNGTTLTAKQMVANGASSGMVSSRRARTAIGITADNKVIALTVDGGKPSTGVSDGATYVEIGQMMQDLGAISAVAMDGGGSTQMNVRLHGEKDIKIVNKPSDGTQRALTNGILFVSKAPRTDSVGSMEVDRDIIIYKGSSYQFKIKGVDTNINPGDFSNVEPDWSLDDGLGKIDSRGIFTAGQNAVLGKVKAISQGASGSAFITVVDTLGALSVVGENALMMDYGSTRQFQLAAQGTDKSQVVITNDAAAWSVTGNIGKIDKNGVLTITARSGAGTVTAQAGGKSVSVKITVQQTSMVIDGFEHADAKRYSVDGSVGGTGSVSSEKAKSGKYSYKISYNYDSHWDRKYNGTINLNPTFLDKAGNDITEGYMSMVRPKKLGMWVYGDGKAPWLRAVVVDGESETKTLDIATRIDWTGWKYVEADIPQDVQVPVSLKNIYFVETNKNLHNKGTVYLDDIKFVYSDSQDVKSPYFTDIKPSSTVYKRDVDISLKILDDKSGVNAGSINMKLDGKPVKASFNASTGILVFTAKGLAEGNHAFEVEAADRAGNKTNPPLKRTFGVSLKADKASPVIKDITPLDWYATESEMPRISANIRDSQTGVDSKSISIKIDGNELKPVYDEASGWVYAIPDSPLSKGNHEVVIIAKDRAGNKTTKETGFTVDPIEQPKNSEKFTVSIAADTHATGFGYEIFKAIKEDDSELVINNGDLIDEDELTQWNDAIKQVSSIGEKYMVLSPGNHDVVGGSLESYMATFGLASPTYSFEYGNSLFISLNSSTGQGISASDPTQFDYLSKMLSRNQKQNVIVFTHVPTRDTFGTKHEMPKGDAARLEKILGDYKKANPSKSINVMFGNLHTSQSWEVSGVTYTIVGNGSLKRYVRPENGGFLAYTKLIIDGSKVTREVVPIVEKISVIDGGLIKGEMNLIRGTKKQLTLYGDFSTLNADYIIPLNPFKDVSPQWKSSNPSVASVSSGGMLTTLSQGDAVITAELSGKKYSFKVICIDQTQREPFKISIVPGSLEVSSGSTTKLETYGWNLYGESYVIDNANVRYEISGDIGNIANGVFTAIQGADKTGTITAVYDKFKAQIPVSIVTSKKYAIVNTETLNMREKPSIDSKILGTLKAGDKVEVISESGEWAKISFNGIQAYVNKTYLK